MIIIVPKIEQYSQNAAIEFYENHATEDVYIETYGFKSYAHLFYSKKRLQKNKKHTNETWLLSGKADKTVYFVTKITKEKEFTEKFPKFKKMYGKNGFSFFVLNKKQ